MKTGKKINSCSAFFYLPFNSSAWGCWAIALWANGRQLSYQTYKKAIAEILGDESVAMASNCRFYKV